MSAELEARRTAAAAALGDFRREDDAFVADDSYTLPVPDYARWASRLATELSNVLAQLADETRSPAAGQLAQIRLVLAAFNWEIDDRQYVLEQIDDIVHGDAPAAAAEGRGGRMATDDPPGRAAERARGLAQLAGPDGYPLGGEPAEHGCY